MTVAADTLRARIKAAYAQGNLLRWDVAAEPGVSGEPVTLMAPLPVALASSVAIATTAAADGSPTKRTPSGPKANGPADCSSTAPGFRPHGSTAKLAWA